MRPRAVTVYSKFVDQHFPSIIRKRSAGWRQCGEGLPPPRRHL